MIDWLSSLVENFRNFAESISSLISNIVNEIRLLFQYVQNAVDFVRGAFQLIPSYYLVFGAIILTVLIVYVVLGRNAGGD